MLWTANRRKPPGSSQTLRFQGEWEKVEDEAFHLQYVCLQLCAKITFNFKFISHEESWNTDSQNAAGVQGNFDSTVPTAFSFSFSPRS
mmetsp:Transcript_41851/g.110862  ORF Transcript_41851/g.110862 Transcript_41851/m.110862 type:complete len:88 (+) Transcript_41851:806-1069(+)